MYWYAHQLRFDLEGPRHCLTQMEVVYHAKLHFSESNSLSLASEDMVKGELGGGGGGVGRGFRKI